MTAITQQSLIAYLRFLKSKHILERDVPPEKEHLYTQLSDEELAIFLEKQYEKYHLLPDAIAALEAEFLNKRTQQPRIEEQPVIEVIEAEEVIDNPAITPLPITPTPLITPPPTNVTSTTRPVPPPKSPVVTKKRSARVYWYVILGVIACWIGYSYIQFQKLGEVYTLTDNVSVRPEPESNKTVDGLFLFGKWADRQGNELTKPSSLKLLSTEPQDGYYKVAAGSLPFFDYLTNNNYFVHSSYVTTDSSEFNAYRRIFKNLDADFYELKNLEFAYRKIIYNALSNGALSELSIAIPCENKFPLRAKGKKPLSIGQFQNANKSQFIVVVRLTDNNYYQIKANGDYDIEEITPITFYYDTTKYDNIYTMEGRFINQGSYFEWQSCDGNYKAKSSGMDLSNFTIE